MSDFDTGDLVQNRLTGEKVQVFCVHGDEFHPLGVDRTLQVGGWDLVTRATSEDRWAILQSVASSSAATHRPQCARETIEKEQHTDDQLAYYDGE